MKGRMEMNNKPKLYVCNFADEPFVGLQNNK